MLKFSGAATQFPVAVNVSSITIGRGAVIDATGSITANSLTYIGAYTATVAQNGFIRCRSGTTLVIKTTLDVRTVLDFGATFDMTSTTLTIPTRVHLFGTLLTNVATTLTIQSAIFTHYPSATARNFSFNTLNIYSSDISFTTGRTKTSNNTQYFSAATNIVVDYLSTFVVSGVAIINTAGLTCYGQCLMDAQRLRTYDIQWNAASYAQGNTSLTVSKGGAVRFLWSTDGLHQVKSANASSSRVYNSVYSSGATSQTQGSYTITFNTIGTFYFFDEVNTGMFSVITVVANDWTGINTLTANGTVTVSDGSHSSTFDMGLSQFTVFTMNVNRYGNMYFQAVGNNNTAGSYIDVLYVNGVWRSFYPTLLTSRNGARMTSIRVDTNGQMDLDYYGFLASTWTDAVGSVILAASITVNGVLQPGQLSFPSLIDTVTVSGSFNIATVNLQQVYPITTIVVSGTLSFNHPIKLETTTSITVSGVLQFDSVGYGISGHPWALAGESQIGCSASGCGATYLLTTVTVNGGVFNGGYLKIFATVLTVNSGSGYVYFEAASNTTSINSIGITGGQVRCRHPTKWLTTTSITMNGGLFNLDDDGQALLVKTWNTLPPSEIGKVLGPVPTIYIGGGATFNAGFLSLIASTVTSTGAASLINFEPYLFTCLVIHFVTGGTSSILIYTRVTLPITQDIYQSGGVFQLDVLATLQGNLLQQQAFWSARPPSKLGLSVSNVVVNVQSLGSFIGGYLQIIALNMVAINYASITYDPYIWITQVAAFQSTGHSQINLFRPCDMTIATAFTVSDYSTFWLDSNSVSTSWRLAANWSKIGQINNGAATVNIAISLNSNFYGSYLQLTALSVTLSSSALIFYDGYNAATAVVNWAATASEIRIYSHLDFTILQTITLSSSSVMTLDYTAYNIYINNATATVPGLGKSWQNYPPSIIGASYPMVNITVQSSSRLNMCYCQLAAWSLSVLTSGYVYIEAYLQVVDVYNYFLITPTATTPGTLVFVYPTDFKVVHYIQIETSLFQMDQVGWARNGTLNSLTTTYKDWVQYSPSRIGWISNSLNVVVNAGGKLDGGYLQWRGLNLTTGATSIVRLQPYNSMLNISCINIGGLLEIYTAVHMEALNGGSLDCFNTLVTGKIYFDVFGQNSIKTDQSTIPIRNIYTYGTWLAGLMTPIVPGVSDHWDYFYIGPLGYVEFTPHLIYLITNADIYGGFKSLLPLSTEHTWTGNSFNVYAPNGIVNISYQGDIQGVGQGSPTNYFVVDNWLISGSMYFSALTIKSNGFINIASTGLISMDRGGCLSDDGIGKGVAHPTNAAGASYGGRGGRGTALAGTPYGSIYYTLGINDVPVESAMNGKWGSGGGSVPAGSLNGGRGGGYLQIHCSGAGILHNGIISVGGGVANAAGASGGSGGSIVIVTTAFNGTGVLRANAGLPSVGGGGSAGGIIVVLSQTGYYQSYLAQAYGSATTTTNCTSACVAENGGPGLILLDNLAGIRELRIDNRGSRSLAQNTNGSATGVASFNSSGAYAHLISPSSSYNNTFDLININGGAQFRWDGNTASVTTGQVVGDYTGYIHILPGQTLDMNIFEPWKRVNISVYPVIYAGSYWITPYATLEWRVQPSLTYDYLRYRSTLNVWGQLNAYRTNILISTGATWQFELSSGRIIYSTGLTVANTAVLNLVGNVDNSTDKYVWTCQPIDTWEGNDRVGRVWIQGGGTAYTRSLQLITVFLNVDYMGNLNANYVGYLTGPGYIATASGAGHGGRGGNVNGVAAGPYYGSYRLPTTFGSGGFGGAYSGGGLLDITVNTTATINGVISVLAMSKASGGSIKLTVGQLQGYGSILATGGNGVAVGDGGGAGGRIAIYWKNMLYWAGNIHAYGGTSGTVGQQGGAGTLYFEFSGGGYTNRTLSVEGNFLNPVNMQIVNFSNLVNDGGRTVLYDDTNPTDSITVDELHVIGNGQVELSPTVSRLASKALQVGMIVGDGTGTLHVGNDQLVIAAMPDHAEYAINSYVYTGGLLTLPTQFICHNTYHFISAGGQLGGVLDLTIGNGCIFEFSIGGSTSNHAPGIYEFNSITVLDGGILRQKLTDAIPDGAITFLVNQLLDIRGGGIFQVKSKLAITAQNVTIRDGGILYTDFYAGTCVNSVYK